MKILMVLCVSLALTMGCAASQVRTTKIVQDIAVTQDGEATATAEVTNDPAPAQPAAEPAAVQPAPVARPATGLTIDATRVIEVGDTTLTFEDHYVVPRKPWIETDGGKAFLGVLGILVGGAVITAGVCGGTDLCSGTITVR